MRDPHRCPQEGNTAARGQENAQYAERRPHTQVESGAVIPTRDDDQDDTQQHEQHLGQVTVQYAGNPVWHTPP